MIGARPNQRLKLPGDRGEELRCLADQPFFCGSAALRQRVLRPQLKRDPLGSAAPPRLRLLILT